MPPNIWIQLSEISGYHFIFYILVNFLMHWTLGFVFLFLFFALLVVLLQTTQSHSVEYSSPINLLTIFHIFEAPIVLREEILGGVQ